MYVACMKCMHRNTNGKHVKVKSMVVKHAAQLIETMK